MFRRSVQLVFQDQHAVLEDPEFAGEFENHAGDVVEAAVAQIGGAVGYIATGHVGCPLQ